MQRADALKFDRGSMWTAFNYVANYIMLKYSYMIKDLKAVQADFETQALGAQKGLEAQALALWNKGDKDGVKALLTKDAFDRADKLLAAWWKLSEDLYVKYNDGYRNDSTALAQPLFYPDWWLKAVGYENGPLSYEKPKTK